MRKFSLFILMILFTLVLAGCKKEYVDPLKDGVLTVGMECAYAPFNWTTATQTENSVPISGSNSFCDGYDVKIARVLADALDVELEVKAIEWDGLIESLKNKGIDVIIAGMSPTEERKQTIAFTDVYFRSEQVVVVKKAGNYANANSVNSFSGAKISAQLGTLQVDLIPQLTGAVASTPLDSYPTLVTALNNNVIDGFIAEMPVAIQVVNNNPDLAIARLTEEGFTVDESDITTAIGLRKADKDLLEKLNNALKDITTTQREEWMAEFISLSSAE